jgi:hypothetical protein
MQRLSLKLDGSALFLKQAERKKREENKERDKLKVQIQRTD